ncbi:hypothetical protein SCLARK_0097 [Spiroplasma clarkii]|nr:hypothetical protein SCLARK_0097 [Spiroplasma clarkii]
MFFHTNCFKISSIDIDFSFELFKFSPTSAFSFAVKFDNKLYCWKINPTLSRLNFVRCESFNSERLLPITKHHLG